MKFTLHTPRLVKRVGVDDVAAVLRAHRPWMDRTTEVYDSCHCGVDLVPERPYLDYEAWVDHVVAVLPETPEET